MKSTQSRIPDASPKRSLLVCRAYSIYSFSAVKLDDAAAKKGGQDVFNRAMSRAMCRTAHEHMKIVCRVVEFVAVDVVYDFTRSKAASKQSLHDGPVLVVRSSFSAPDCWPSSVHVLRFAPRSAAKPLGPVADF
jgi:hypothetical protein